MPNNHSKSRRAFLTAGALAFGGTALSESTRATRTFTATAELTDWPQHQFDAANAGYHPNAVGPKTAPEETWSHRTYGGIGHLSGPVLASGRVFVPGNGGNLWALDADTGEQTWKYQTGADAFQSTPAVAEGRVVVGDRDGTIHGVDAASGERVWEYAFRDDHLVAVPAVADGTVYLAEGPVVALDAKTGTERWTNDDLRAFATTTVADDAVYTFRKDANDVYALDAATGDLRWETAVPARLDQFCQPTVADGTLYVGGADNTVIALDVADGATKWTFETDDVERDRFFSSPAVHDGTVYFGSTNGTVYAVNAADGTERWSKRTDGQVNVSPTVADGVVYVGNATSTVYAFDSKSGETLWTHELGEGPLVGQLIPSGGQLFVPHHGGGLVALEAGQQPGSATTSERRSSVRDGTATTTAERGRDAHSETTAFGFDREARTATRTGQRGFFSNGGDDSAFLSDALNLTVLGFLLSAAGIVYQLVNGR